MQIPLREGDVDTRVGEGLVDGPIQRRDGADAQIDGVYKGRSVRVSALSPKVSKVTTGGGSSRTCSFACAMRVMIADARSTSLP
jgi:hypothetical protein